MQIYGGSAAVEALSYGVSSTQELPDSDVILRGEDVNFNRQRRSECSETEYEDADENEETPDQNSVATVNSAPVPAPVPTPGTKRPLAPAAAIPRLLRVFTCISIQCSNNPKQIFNFAHVGQKSARVQILMKKAQIYVGFFHEN